MTPAMALATWFWCGLSPKAPGTVGSLGALPVAWAILEYGGGWPWLALAAVAATAIGTWAAAAVLRRSSIKDPGFVVIDEVAGQWIALLPVALFPAMGGGPGPDPVLFAGGFVAFRLFDILKPWPVSWADRSVAGAWGVMLDDLIAGAYAAVVVYVTGRMMTGGI